MSQLQTVLLVKAHRWTLRHLRPCEMLLAEPAQTTPNPPTGRPWG